MPQLPVDDELIWSRMVSCAVVAWPLRLAGMVTGPAGALLASVIVKKALVPDPDPEKAVTVTEAGTDAAAGLLLDSATTPRPQAARGIGRVGGRRSPLWFGGES